MFGGKYDKYLEFRQENERVRKISIYSEKLESNPFLFEFCPVKKVRAIEKLPKDKEVWDIVSKNDTKKLMRWHERLYYKTELTLDIFSYQKAVFVTSGEKERRQYFVSLSDRFDPSHIYIASLGEETNKKGLKIEATFNLVRRYIDISGLDIEIELPIRIPVYTGFLKKGAVLDQKTQVLFNFPEALFSIEGLYLTANNDEHGVERIKQALVTYFGFDEDHHFDGDVFENDLGDTVSASSTYYYKKNGFTISYDL